MSISALWLAHLNPRGNHLVLRKCDIITGHFLRPCFLSFHFLIFVSPFGGLLALL